MRSVCIDGQVILLDLRVGRYSALDATASALWSALIEPRCEPENGDELEAFAASCVRDGYLSDTAVPQSAAPMRPHRLRDAFMRQLRGSAFAAWLILVDTNLRLRRGGFVTLYRRCAQQRPAQTARAPVVPSIDLPRCLRAFKRADSWFWSRRAPNDCLQRSLALFRFLKAAGWDVAHCIGVMPMPFRAHAWVECAASVVLDSESVRANFVSIARL